jgi:large subunit ribosomal protein L19
MSDVRTSVQSIERKQLRQDLPPFRAGDTVRVNVKIIEGDKERVQAFEGVVIRIHRGGSRASFTVRKVSYGVGVERIFPMHSPRMESVELLTRGRVRRGRLYYLRQRMGRAAKVEAALFRNEPSAGTAAQPEPKPESKTEAAKPSPAE